MVKCEKVKASIGIKILLSDLILQINETNFNLIKEMLNDGFIEDENDYFNEVYDTILYNEDLDNLDYVDTKEYFIHQFTNNGTYIKRKYSNLVKSSLYHGCLFEKKLLLPIKEILSNDRWGYDRNGTNCISRRIDFDLTMNIDKYKEIEKTEIVFILGQHSG